MGEPPGLQIVLQLALGTSPIRGHFSNASGTPAEFVGWQELTEALERAVQEASSSPASMAPRAVRSTGPSQAGHAFQIRIVPGSDPVSGEVQDGPGPPAAFNGWLELATLLDGIRLGR